MKDNMLTTGKRFFRKRSVLMDMFSRGPIPLPVERHKEPAMTLGTYQARAFQYANYDDKFYPKASLMVEAAELADLFVKPELRGDDKEVDSKEVLSEAGDVLWNLAAILSECGLSLEDAAAKNLEKLADRKKRGVIRGDGGNR